MAPSTSRTGSRTPIQQAVDRAAHGVARALTFWRRSVQARVVASTVLLSAAVVAGVGWFLMLQTRDGLLNHRVDAAVAEAENETAEAANRLSFVPGTDADALGQQQDLVEDLIARGASRGFAVILSPPVSKDSRLADGGAKFTQGLKLSSAPPALQEHFEEPAPTAHTFTRVRTTSPIPGVPTGPGVVVGNQITLPADSQTYTLYYVFSLHEEVETLALVQRALLTAGALFLFLVAGVTWLVARQVVTPIRMARRVAERLAAGQLQERLRVRGEDDLARLAVSFNQMASNLQSQIRQLEELSRLQRRFVSDVSHELRTPLTTVRMAGDVLHDAKESFDPATARAAELLQGELDRFERLLADLLEISRFDAGAAALEAGDVDLEDVAHRVASMTAAMATQRRTRVVVRPSDGPCVVEGDVRRVERIVRNLVTNAIDHAESRDVEVLLAADDHAASLAVRDHGVGLAPGESAMVFNRFWRADPARARTSGGTGLGLPISLEDTHLHGGWLQAWGRRGEGTQFRLTLPRKQTSTLRHSPLPLVPADAEPAGRQVPPGPGVGHGTGPVGTILSPPEREDRP